MSRFSLFVCLGLCCLVGGVAVAEDPSEEPAQKEEKDAPAETEVELKDVRDQAGYAIGLDIGANLRQQGLDVNLDALLLGLKDALAKTKPRLSNEEIAAAMQALQKQMVAKRQAVGVKNAAEGAKFLEANKKKEGVKALESGLQYKVLKSGKGKSPKLNDNVTTHYHGTLIDGTVFDSSVERGEPASFPVNGVISGWTEALQLMKVGDKWQLFVPAELAYKDRGSGPVIGPNTTLIFEVELLGIDE